MDRIENILQRLQSIYYDKRDKTEIDLDLMLDYTRVLYADILEWKQQLSPKEATTVKDSSKAIIQEESRNDTVNSHQDTPLMEKEAKEIPPATINEKEEQTQLKYNPIKEEEPQKIQKEPVKETKSQEGVSFKEIKEEETELEKTQDLPSKEEKEENSPSVLKIKKEIETAKDQTGDKVNFLDVMEDPFYFEPKDKEPEEAPEEFFYRERSVLSFELPKEEDEAKSQKPSIKEKTDSNEKEIPVQQQIPPIATSEKKEKNEDEPKKSQVNPLFPDFEDTLFVKRGPTKTVDIRKNIGLNDRYLFLNELFNQDKAEYESALDQLNKMTAFEEALTFANDLASKHNWTKDDETTQSFYTALSKHFSDK